MSRKDKRGTQKTSRQAMLYRTVTVLYQSSWNDAGQYVFENSLNVTLIAICRSAVAATHENANQQTLF